MSASGAKRSFEQTLTSAKYREERSERAVRVLNDVTPRRVGPFSI
jgi:hypothetical protein